MTPLVVALRGFLGLRVSWTQGLNAASADHIWKFSTWLQLLPISICTSARVPVGRPRVIDTYNLICMFR